MLKKIVFSACLIVIILSLFTVMQSQLFNNWENREVSKYYLEHGIEETESPNVVAAIVWDFRGFDTLGEETVLFTAAVGVFTVIVFGFNNKRKVE